MRNLKLGDESPIQAPVAGILPSGTHKSAQRFDGFVSTPPLTKPTALLACGVQRTIHMSAIDSLMKRFGLVRLDQYGLSLTVDDRIVSTRPVLDDGFGVRIVGWRGDDLVAMQLETWPAAQPPARAATQAARRAAPQSARPTAAQAAPGWTPVPAPNIPASESAPVEVLPQPSMVAGEPPVEEDWEWEIAVARARAVADEVEQAVIELSSPKPKAWTQPSQPFAKVATPKLENTVPYAQNPFVAANWDESRTPRSVVKTVVRPAQDSFPSEPTRQVNAWARDGASQRTLASRAQSPKTIIAVPSMPRAMEHQSRLTPVIRASQAPLPPRRTAKGTGQQPSEDTVLTAPSPEAVPHSSLRPARPANDDTTKPSVALPRQQLPSITRRFAAAQK